MANGIQLGVVSAPVQRDAVRVQTDSYLIADDARLTWLGDDLRERTKPAGGAGVLLAVAQGFGRRAAVASASAMQVIGKLYRPGLPDNPSRAMLDYLGRAHRRLRERAAQSGAVDLGASLTVAWILEGRVHWVQIGGTRLYVLRKDRLVRLTPIHDRREFQVRDGESVDADEPHLVQAFLWGSDGLGSDAALRLEPGLDSGTEYLEVGDRLLMCTGGISDVVDEVSMYDVLRNVPDPKHASVGLAERARARGGRHQATAIVARVDRLPAKTLPGVREGTGRTFF